jgi:DNA-binding MarR family transcriptional regulator
VPKGKPISRIGLQKMLYERADRLGRLKIHQRQLAAELEVTYFAVCRVLQRMEDEGRVKVLKAGKDNIKTYVIREPA